MVTNRMVDQRELDEPGFRKRGRVWATTPERTVLAGHYGRCEERDAIAFVTERHAHNHRIRGLESDSGGSYAISIDALRTMNAVGVEYVFVLETNTEDVYEWKYDAFAFAEEVPLQFLEHKEDGQKYAPRDSARAIWRNHADSFYTGDAPTEASFTPATELKGATE